MAFPEAVAARKPEAASVGKGPGALQAALGRVEGGVPTVCAVQAPGAAVGQEKQPIPEALGLQPPASSQRGKGLACRTSARGPGRPRGGGRTGRSGSTWAGSCFDSAVAPRVGSPALRRRASGWAPVLARDLSRHQV